MSSGQSPSSSSAFGSHDVVRLVAKGGMGTVFEVRDRATGARAAAKTILNARDPGARIRFRREAELLARCGRIPGIVKVHSFGDAPDGCPYVILDYIDGPSLEAVLEKKSKLDPLEATSTVRDVARALGAIHAQGIVHRDVKPANILIDPEGRPWLTDFGLATARDLERLTVTGAFVGTIAYCSPEQAAGEPCVPASDVFALGCVLFRALAGVPPIETASPLAHMGQLAGPERVRDVRSAEESVPAPLAAIVARALEKKAALRYRSGEELARDLDRFLSGARVAGAPSRSPRRLLVALALVALAILLAVLVLVRVKRGLAESALEEAQVEAEKARSVLARGDLDGAGAAIARARSRLAAAGTAGIDSARAAVDAAAGELAAARAERSLARGLPVEALGELSAAASLAPEGHLVRARALVATGKTDEAAKEVEAWQDALPRGRRGEALELLGDALLGRDDARAERAYAAAEEAGRRTPDLRAREAGAAAGCGDDAAALALFAALVRDPENLSPDRKANAALARIAPALYRKGLAAGDDHFLETAWRLAPPPAELTLRVHERFLAAAGEDAARWATAFMSRLSMGSEELEEFRAILARAGRLRPAGFDLYAAGFAPALGVVRTWTKSAGPEEAEGMGRVLVADWPDLCLGYFVLASSRKKTVLAPATEGFDWVLRAIELLPPPRPDEDTEVRRVATLAGILSLELAERARVPRDLVQARRAVERGGFGDGWFVLGRALRREGRGAEARAALDLAADRETTGSVHLHFVEIESERVEVFIQEGARAEALDRSRKLLATSDGVGEGARLLGELGAWDDIATSVDPTKIQDEIALAYWGMAVLKQGRLEDAKRMIPRVQRDHLRANELARAIRDYEAAHR